MPDEQRTTLVNRIPDETLWETMPEASQRAVAQALLHDAIELIAGEQREPDNWEALELRCAIDALEQGLYATLLVFVERALLPVTSRRAFLGFRRESVVSLAELRSAFASSQAAEHPASTLPGRWGMLERSGRR